MWVCVYRAKNGKLVVGMHLSDTKEKSDRRGQSTYPKAFLRSVFVDVSEPAEEE